MSGSQSQTLVQVANPAVITGITIRSGETISVGDKVALDYGGQAIKVSAPTENSVQTGLTNAGGVKAVIETSLDKYLIIVANSSANYFIFYNKATDTVINVHNPAGLVNQLYDVRVLPNGEIVVMWADGANINVAKYTAAGTIVGTVQGVAALTSATNPNTSSFLAPSPISGEFFACYQNLSGGSYTLLVTQYNTSMANQGTSSVGGGAAAWNNNAALTAIGTTTIGIIWPGASGGLWHVVLNASTRAIVGTQSNFGGIAFTRSLAITYDATNAQYVIFASHATLMYIAKLSQSGGVLTALYNVAQTSTTNSHMLTSLSAAMGGFVYEYTAASGGTVTRKQIYSTNGEYLYANNTAYTVPNYCYEAINTPQSGGVTAAYLYVPNGNAFHCYSVNPTTGKATGLFSIPSSSPASMNKPAVRSGGRMDISARVENDIGTSNWRVIVRRYDAGIMYGTAKAVANGTVDIDTSKLNGGTTGDSNLLPIRPRGEVLAGDNTYFIGG